jgi:hypothetical protein
MNTKTLLHNRKGIQANVEYILNEEQIAKSTQNLSSSDIPLSQQY